MKNQIILGIIVITSPFILLAENTKNNEKALTLYKEAVALQKKGEVLEAIEKLELATVLSPSFTKARNLHIQLDSNKTRIIYNQKLEKLNNVMIKRVDFDDDSLAVALEKLKDQIKEFNEANKTSFNTNFVVTDKSKAFEKYKIKLNLRNIPLKVVLDNMMMLVKGSYRIEEHAIMVTSSED